MVSERPIASAPPPSGATTERAAGPFGPISDGPCSRRRRAAIALVSIAAFVLYAVESVFRQQQFKSSVDITIFQQAIANYAHGRAPEVLVKSQEPFNILGDHFSPILIVLAPFYRIWPSVVTLLIAQAFLLAVGVHVVTRVAVARLGGLGYYIGISFALSWGILKVLDFDFHEACFVVAFLALAMEALKLNSSPASGSAKNPDAMTRLTAAPLVRATSRRGSAITGLRFTRPGLALARRTPRFQVVPSANSTR